MNSLAITPQDFIRLATMFQKFNFKLLVRAPQSGKEKCKHILEKSLLATFRICLLHVEVRVANLKTNTT